MNFRIPPVDTGDAAFRYMAHSNVAKLTVGNVLASMFLLFMAVETSLIYFYSPMEAICVQLYAVGRSEGCTFSQASNPLDGLISPET